MKLKQKKKATTILSDRIAEALTVKAAPDIEDDQVFGTKPKTVSRADFDSSDSEEEATISEFRRQNVNLLSEVSKKYEGEVVSRKSISNLSDSAQDSDSEGSEDKVERKSDNNQILIKDSGASSSEDDTQLNSTKNNISVSDDVSSDDAESEDYSITNIKKQMFDSDDAPSGEEDGSEGSDDEEGYDISQLDEPMKEDFEHVKKQNISEEAKKGSCVRNQLLLWEGLLEMRIHLQRCVSTANQMPLPETYEEVKQNKEFAEAATTVKTNIMNTLDKMLSLQDMLYKNFPDTKTLVTTSKKQPDTTQAKGDESDEEIPSDTDNEEIPSDTEDEEETKIENKNDTSKDKQNVAKKRKFEDYEKELSTKHKAFKSFRDSTIQKWNEKTRIATAANFKNAPTNTIMQQISYILSDRNKLIRRTQLKRSEYDIIGYKKQIDTNTNGDEPKLNKDRKEHDEYIPEIFDDSDFYHQLLRELIECKSADISDPVQMSRQWIALQQMRSKMKRKVDTKATKGRKIKYVVHNQLVNYMAPEKDVAWSDESKNELYSSLFGKLFEANNAGLNAKIQNDLIIK